MATPNYGFEKRQKELAKKRKKEEKLKEKAARKHVGPQSDSDAPTDQEEPGSTTTGDGTTGPASSDPRSDPAQSS